MPEYRRLECPGARVFFTVVTFNRHPNLRDALAVELLRAAFRQELAHHPFTIDAAVVLPDHLHCIWTLPHGDDDFSSRWGKIKGTFTEQFLAAGGHEGGRNASRRRRKERAVWQRRFWDRVIRDDDELDAYMDYIHYNPVKHGHAKCPHDWPYSSFRRWVAAGRYPPDWACVCARPVTAMPDFARIAELTGE